MIAKLYPSASEMDLDMLKVSPEVIAKRQSTRARILHDKGGDVVVIIPKPDPHSDGAVRDTLARRIEMMGDLYEELRLLADRAQAAGLDVEQAKAVLGEFVAPKPFARLGDGA